MEFKGRIERLLPIRKGVRNDGTEWHSQEFVFEYHEHDTDRFSDKVLLSLMNDRIKEYDLHEGDEVTIGFGHNIREWQGRIFNEVRIYKFEKVKGVAVVQQQTEPTINHPEAQPTHEPAVISQSADESGKKDDLPF